MMIMTISLIIMMIPMVKMVKMMMMMMMMMMVVVVVIGSHLSPSQCGRMFVARHGAFHINHVSDEALMSANYTSRA